MRFAACVALLSACEGAGPAPQDGDIDGGSMAPRIEIGTGGVGRWEDLAEAGTALLARGCQGSQHVWLSLRVWHLDTSPAIVEGALLFDRGECLEPEPPDGCQPSVPLQIRVTFDTEDGRDYAELTGINLQVPDASAVEHQDCVIRVRVAENMRGGPSAEADKRVTVEWGDEVCGMRLDDGAVPPTDEDGGIDAGG